MFRLLRLVLLVAVVLLGVVLCGCDGNEAQPEPVQLGGPAPDFQLGSLDGREVSLSGLRGKPVLLNFWASWCGPCRSEMSFFQEVFEDEEWADKGLVILAVNLGEGSGRVDEYMEEYALSFPVLLDTDQAVGRKYNIRGIPATFFIDKNGIIKDIGVGAFASKEEIDWRLLNSILAEE